MSTSNETPVTIVKLEAANVKRLKAVAIKPSGSTVVVRGNNAQGKTSLLDAIQLALGGKSLQPPKVIREGEEKAEIVVELSNGLVVRRHWTANDRPYLSVTSKDGGKLASPQAILDKLTGALSFDPLAFLSQKPADQLATLKKLVGVDTSALDAEHARLFADRTVVNREVDTLRAQVAGMPPIEAPEKEESIASLLAERQTLEAQRRANEARRAKTANLRRHANQMAEGVAMQRGTIDGLRMQLREAEERLAGLQDLADLENKAASNAEAADFELVDPDLSGIDARMASLEATNAAVRAKAARDQVIAKGLAAKAKADDLSARLTAIAEQREQLVSSARFPVEGLGFGEGGITFQGLPIEQASQAERLRVSLAMGLALNPKLKVITLRDASLLDEKSLALVEQMAADAGAQVWLEMVGTSGEASVVIEDGSASGPDSVDPTSTD